MSKVLEFVAQPDVNTCQSACIAKVLGTDDVYGIRADLEAIGVAGDPAVMGEYLRPRVKSYKFLLTGSLNDAKAALDDGCVVITHGWFSHSGHVICLVGYEADPNTLSYRFIVDDPYGEFDFSSGQYDTSKSGNNVRYSSYGIYAYCVAASGYGDADEIYRRKTLLSTEQNAWFHIIKN
ncbi:MAG: hypothetical protein KME10_15180 [Plectolyngbya sp. WJT66-NPBG17]|jgi:hypothetical protein|nr:hypothetical protein [Plectolyngbya sp. WJT66-NPBG17]MBW4526674.1 hypothetical protein [Phormidium tanganyikae FI6-MK23]